MGIADASMLELAKRGLIPLGLRKVSREGSKFKIYLPSHLNSLWKELHEKGMEIEIYIKIASGGASAFERGP